MIVKASIPLIFDDIINPDQIDPEKNFSVPRKMGSFFRIVYIRMALEEMKSNESLLYLLIEQHLTKGLVAYENVEG